MPATSFPRMKHAAALGIRYRDVTDADKTLLSKIYASTRIEEVAATGWPVDQQSAFLQMQFEAQHEHYQKHYPDALWLVVEQASNAIGRLYIEDWSDELRIIDIALLPEHRRQGVGGAILSDLMDGAEATGRKVSIHVEKNNPALGLYGRLGFEPVQDKGVYTLLEWRPGAQCDIN